MATIICTTVQKVKKDFKVNNEIQECYYHHLNAFSETTNFQNTGTRVFQGHDKALKKSLHRLNDP